MKWKFYLKEFHGTQKRQRDKEMTDINTGSQGKRIQSRSFKVHLIIRVPDEIAERLLDRLWIGTCGKTIWS